MAINVSSPKAVVKVTADNASLSSNYVYVSCTVEGPQGDPGQGVPVGGTAGQVLEKIDGTDYNTQWADISAGLVGWEVAELVEGSGQYLANKTELQRAYATGSPIYIPPGTYELDDCLLTGQTDCIIWADSVTFKWADDPSIVGRTTEAMLEIEPHAGDVKINGITFDLNAAGAYNVDTASHYGLVIEANASSGDLYLDDVVFFDGASSCVYINGTATTTNRGGFKNVYIGRVSLVDGFKYLGINLRGPHENIVIDDYYQTDGSATNTKQASHSEGTRGLNITTEVASSFESVKNVHVKSLRGEYCKAGLLYLQNVKTFRCDYFLSDNFLRNNDGTDTLVKGTGYNITKWSSGIADGDDFWQQNISFGTLITKNTNTNNQTVFPGNPGTSQNLSAVNIEDASPRFNADYMDVDAPCTIDGGYFQADSNNYFNGIGTLIYRGGRQGAASLNILGSCSINKLIIDTKQIPVSLSKQSSVSIRGDVYVGYLKNIGSVDVSFNSTGLSFVGVNAGNDVVGWNVPSRIVVENAYLDSDATVRIPLTSSQFVVDGINDRCHYIDLSFHNATIHNIELSVDNLDDISSIRDRVRVRAHNSKFSESTGGVFNAYVTNGTSNSFLRVSSTAGGVTLTDNTVAGQELDAGAKDLPENVIIGPSEFVNCYLANSSTNPENGTFINTLSVGGDLVDDTTPQLGGDLDLNGNDITGTGNVFADSLNLNALQAVPGSSGAPGTVGEIRFTSNYIYICTATNTWKRWLFDDDTFGSIFLVTAAALPDFEENNTTGWVDGASRGGVISVATDAAEVNGSTYALKVRDPSSIDFVRAEYTLSVLDATTYNVSFDYKVVEFNGDTMGLNQWTGITVGPTDNFNTDGNWHTLSFSITTNSTSLLMRFYATKGTASTGPQSFVIDNLSIEPA